MAASFQTLTLDELCLRIKDGAHHSPKSVPDGLPMASVKDLTPHGINLSTCRLISRDDFELLVRRGCKPEIGDVLIAKDGASALDTVCEVKSRADVVLLSSVAILRPDPGKLLATYLRYYLDAEPVRQYMKNAFTTGAAIPRVVLEDFKRVLVSVPALRTQRKIAAILSAYDDLIENNLRRIAILEEMARLIYREWFVHFRFPGHEGVRMVDSPLGEIPEGWAIVKFVDVADVLSGGTPRTSEAAYWNGPIPFFIPKDASDGFYVLETEKSITELGLSKCNSQRYPKDTVFITARGTVGKVVMPAVDMAMNQSCYALVGRSGMTQPYLFLMTLQSVDYLRKHTGGATFETIVVDTFRRFDIVRPPLSLIGNFTGRVQPVFDSVLNHLQRNALLRRTRDLLLPRLISGELDVEELDIDTPPSAS